MTRLIFNAELNKITCAVQCQKGHYGPSRKREWPGSFPTAKKRIIWPHTDFASRRKISDTGCYINNHLRSWKQAITYCNSGMWGPRFRWGLCGLHHTLTEGNWVMSWIKCRVKYERFKTCVVILLACILHCTRKEIMLQNRYLLQFLSSLGCRLINLLTHCICKHLRWISPPPKCIYNTAPNNKLVLYIGDWTLQLESYSTVFIYYEKIDN